jgi:Ran GTPase-activating protein (RanGAP) involved in mRNA processing and transport
MIENQCRKCEIGYHLTTYSVQLLSKALLHNRSLEELSIRGAGLDASAAVELGKGLRNFADVKIVSVSVNLFGDDGVIGFCKGLKYCKNLQELWISNNEIGDIGAFALGIALGKGCKKIRSVNLNNNNISEKGLLSMVKEMTQCTKLSFLYLMNNKVLVDNEEEQENLKRKIKNDIVPSCTTIIL